MTARKLISLLKKMPQNLQVQFSAHDNHEWELAGDICSVTLFDKSDPDCQPVGRLNNEDQQWYDDQPDRAVVLRG